MHPALHDPATHASAGTILASDAPVLRDTKLSFESTVVPSRVFKHAGHQRGKQFLLAQLMVDFA